MSKLITNTLRHTGGSADNITLDGSQNVTVEGNLTVDGTSTLTGAVTLPDNTVTLAKMAGGTDEQIITYDANGDPVAVGPGSDGQVVTATGAGSPPAFETISTQDTLSNRNILYNGAMQISQRAASTGVGASNGAIFATDRWSVYTQNTGSRYTISQDGESPDGFGYTLKID